MDRRGEVQACAMRHAAWGDGARVRVRVRVRVRACACVRVRACACAGARVRERACVRARACACVRVRARAFACVRVRRGGRTRQRLQPDHFAGGRDLAHDEVGESLRTCQIERKGSRSRSQEPGNVLARDHKSPSQQSPT
eukprot:4089721-Pleurochrysis_carterae.AAC.1